jgi:hypothetical protein
MTQTLASFKEALQQPFAPETIQFLPKEIRKENGKQVCSALPYANKRIYEDRLNALVFGDWSTPATQPYAQGNKLIIPVTVIILGVAHTDYGEAFLLASGKNGSTREDENTATEAYSQAFRRACAKFSLGRYLYDLPKLTLPYDLTTRQIAISKAERIAWVEKLYQTRGLLPKVYVVPAKPSAAPLTSQPVTSPTVLAQPLQVAQAVPQLTETAPEAPAHSHPTSYADTFLDWVCRTVNRDPERIQGICSFYQIQQLKELSVTQRQNLTRQLQKQAASPAPASSSLSLQTKH